MKGSSLLLAVLGLLVLSAQGVADEGSRPGVLRFRRLHVRDELIGQEAFTMLIPAGWRSEGGVLWRPNPFKPATGVLRISSPDGRMQFEILPQMPFVDGAREAAIRSVRVAGPQAMAMMEQRYAEGQLCFGNEIRRRVDDPAQFVRQFVLPRYRADLRDLSILAEEGLPAVADALAGADPAEQGTVKMVRAARTRIGFSLRGQPYEEDIYCVLVLVDIPPIQQTLWGADHLVAFRAPRGEVDTQSTVVRTMCSSMRIDLRWYNKYVQVVHSLIQGQIQEIRAIGEFSRRWAQMSDEVSSDRQRSWEANQARMDEMDRRYSQYQRGVEEYRDTEGNRVELPAGYTHGWRSRGDEYIVTDNPNFNPNVEMTGDWTPLERVP